MCKKYWKDIVATKTRIYGDYVYFVSKEHVSRTYRTIDEPWCEVNNLITQQKPPGQVIAQITFHPAQRRGFPSPKLNTYQRNDSSTKLTLVASHAAVN